MSNTKNSFSSLIAQFLRLQKNSLEIINKLNDVTTSPKDSVEIEFLMDDNTSRNIQVPSYGFLKSEINRIDQNVIALSGLENNTANIRKADGTISKIYQANVLKDPSSPSSLQVPSTFQARNNWFFESFLNPLLYISINVENQIPENSDRVMVKRIVANTQTNEEKQYFDNNLKGRNDLSDIDFVSILQSRGIQYFVDEQVNDLELRSIRYKGSFSVLRIFDEQTEITSNGITTVDTVRKYKLDGLRYTDTLSVTDNSRTLTIGDKLITTSGTKYEITSIDSSNQTVILKRLFGFDPIQIGNNKLSIYTDLLSSRTVDVNVSFDERQAVFIKSINEDFNIASSTYSPGICFWSNELQINTSDGVKLLDSFYKSEVSDFGRVFLAAAKENSIPAVYGQTPMPPSVSGENFKVVQINSHITGSKEGKSFNEKIQSKTTLKNEISSIDSSIDQTRKQLSDLTTTSTSKMPSTDFKKLNDKIASLTKEKATKTDLLSTIITDLNNLVVTTPELSEAPKYRVRGFWPFPAPIMDPKTGEQNIIQFNVRYRYLSLTGNSTGTTQIDFVDNDGIKRTGQFANWVQFKSDIRKKEYNSNTGLYVWKIEDVSDANTANINQLDIPITKGEKIEIQVQAISEAGWPNNPLTSDWSTSIIVEFPRDLSVTIDNTPLIAQNVSDNTTTQIQKDLQAKGLDQHLSTSFNSNDKYFSHVSNSISSGFFDSSGKSIDLFQKLTQIDNELQSLRALIAKAKGTLGVYIRSGNSSNKINKGSTLNLFGGYYDQLIDLSNPNNKGKIATVIYYLELRNEAATPLELSSLIPGGQSINAPTGGTDDYTSNRKYWATPLQLSGVTNKDVLPGATGPLSFIQLPGYQSGNAHSQFAYPRYKSVGLDQNLYFGAPIGNTPAGIPLDKNGILTPWDPTLTSTPGIPNVNIWNGVGTSGGGPLNDFCIHVSHPSLTGGATFSSLVNPPIVTNMTYPAFRHSLGFESDTNTTDFLGDDGVLITGGVNGRQTLSIQQLEFTPLSTNGGGTNSTDYPNKLGFIDSDEFLCGKYSCGSYLFMAPTNHSAIQIEGSTQLAKKTLEFGQENGIVIPIIFQMRAQDKLGYVGGWRSGSLKNITYAKKMGIDIYIKNEEVFSFDILVSGSYTKTSLVSPAYSQNVITTN